MGVAVSEEAIDTAHNDTIQAINQSHSDTERAIYVAIAASLISILLAITDLHKVIGKLWEFLLSCPKAIGKWLEKTNNKSKKS